MQILRIRRGFQADHSSSSYLFYAADKPVSQTGKQIAHRFSSRADVEGRWAHYTKWGGSELSVNAYKALMTEHYDVMVSESYDWWTFIIAVPQTSATRALPKRFEDARGHEDMGIDIEKFGSRWAITIYCALDYNSAVIDEGDDFMEQLVKLLTKVRQEIIQGNFSFLQAVADFYGAVGQDDEDLLSEETTPPLLDPNLTKVQLQQECRKRGVEFRSSWDKERLKEALLAPPHAEKLSPAAKKLLRCLDRV